MARFSTDLDVLKPWLSRFTKSPISSLRSIHKSCALPCNRYYFSIAKHAAFFNKKTSSRTVSFFQRETAAHWACTFHSSSLDHDVQPATLLFCWNDFMGINVRYQLGEEIPLGRLIALLKSWQQTFLLPENMYIDWTYSIPIHLLACG